MNTDAFDRSLKQLVDFDPHNWATLAGIPDVVSGMTLNTELAATNRRVDALMSICIPNGQCAVHLEFQAGKDGRQVPRRLLEYSNGITAKHQLPVHTCVFLLTARADSPALTGEYHRRIAGQGHYLTYSYTVVRFWKLPLEMLLIPGSSVAAAGVLADFGEYSLQAAGMAITQCILDNPNSDAQLEILGHAYTLAGMRFNRDTADSIFERQMTMLEQSSTVQHLLHRGRKEGREEGHLLGMLAGARKHFIETSTLFFGPVPEHCSLRVNTAQEADITRWTSRLRTAASWDELLGLDNISIQSLEMQDDRNRPLVD
jgi:predicted transposase YdaD